MLLLVLDEYRTCIKTKINLNLYSILDMAKRNKIIFILVILFLNYISKYFFSEQSIVINYITAAVIIIASTTMLIQNKKTNIVFNISLLLSLALFFIFCFIE